MPDVPIILRLTIADPVPDVHYALQEGETAVRGVVATTAPLSFDVPVRLSSDNRFLGPFVRREGPKRRFVYITINRPSSDPALNWSRRAKIDIHDIPLDLLDAARAGKVLEIVLPGRGRDGTPACATVRSLTGWSIAGPA